MAKNFRGSGDNIDYPGIIESGITITAGSMVYVDLSGTSVVRRVSAPAHTDNFIGVLANTQTGVANLDGGSQTGVVIHRRGIFEFQTETNSTGSEVRVGGFVYAGTPEAGITGVTIRGMGDTAGVLTGLLWPLGVCVFLPEGRDDTATSVRVHVDIRPDRTIHVLTGIAQ